MEGWKEGTISSVATIGNGCDYKHLKGGDVPVYGTGGYMTSVNDFLYDGETVCIGRKGTIDAPLFHSGKIWTVDTLFYTHSFNNILPKYLFYIFQTINWKKYNEATGVPSLSKRTIEQIEISFPESEDEQRKITSILSTIGQSIEQTEQLITKYKNIKKGLMHDLLTYGIDENGNIRNPQTHVFVEKMGVLVPEEWEVKRIDEIANVTGGKRLPAGHEYSAINTGFRYLRVTDFYNKTVDYSSLENIEERTFNELERYEILPNELFISIAGSIGYIGVNKPDISDRIILTENALKISVYEKIIPDFLSMQMNSTVVQKQIWSEIGTGGGVPKLAKHRVESLHIPYPKWNSKYDEQRKIVSILEHQDKLIDSEQTNLNKLQMLKQGLMQDLLTGKVRVP